VFAPCRKPAFLRCRDVASERAGELGVTAKRAFVATLVGVAVVAGSLALWELKLLIALLLYGLAISAAMRPGVERLADWRIPRPAGIALHYVALLALVGVLLWLIVPKAIDQVQAAIGNAPAKTSPLKQAAKHSSGLKHSFLVALDKRLENLPSGSKFVRPAIDITKKAVEVIVGIIFMLAIAAYWIFERDRAVRVLTCTFPRSKRRVARETWELIDLKLGAFVRGQLLMIAFVSTMLSLAFWLDGLPYWLLLGVFSGIVEIVPVVGPLAAAVVSIGVGLTVDWQTALGAAIAVWGLRLLQDYLVVPKVIGHAVGVSPLLMLVTVSALGLLFGGFYVLLSAPVAAVIGTVVEVVLLDRDPAKHDVPAVLFPPKERQTG
jgi:predicted PurR-regulated permease PerM